MAIPDFQSLMLPLLKVMQDGQEHTQADLRDTLATQYNLTSSELAELLPSGTQRRFDNRITWVKIYFAKARLLDRTGRGVYRITERSSEALRKNPTKIDRSFLMQYPEFQKWQTQPGNGDEPHVAVALITQTPEEVLDSSYQTLRQTLAQDILARVKQITPQNFERLVVDLLLAMGYGGSRSDAGQAVGKNGDGGIDGIIKENKLGLDVIYMQAKRWENTVGSPDVQAFVGSL